MAEPSDQTRLALPVRTRMRRSQQERRAATRARILEAVVESIAEVGFARTTAAEISRRSGVTWGAVQHHFGGKDEMLVAVLEDSFNRFAVRLDDIVTGERSLADRVDLFVDRAWEHFSSPHYRATFEILLNYLSREGGEADRGDGAGASWQERMTKAWDAVWRRVFFDSSLSRRRSLVLQHYTVSALSGLASTAMLAGGTPAVPAEELALLKSTLLEGLGGG